MRLKELEIEIERLKSDLEEEKNRKVDVLNERRIETLR